MVSDTTFTRGAGYWSCPQDEEKRDLFNQLTEVKSQRESWYRVTPYVAEFWCTLSNVGFILVGLKHRSVEVLFAGGASFLSHAIPKQWLLTVDKIGAAVVIFKLIREYQVLWNNLWLIQPLAATGLLNLIDVYAARQQAMTFPHVAWHLTAAMVTHAFLEALNAQNIKEPT